MECLAQIALHRFPISSDGIRHGRCRLTRRCKQRLDETNGFVSIQLNQVALIDDLASNFASMSNHESCHRASFNGSRSLEKLFIRHRNSCNESLSFLLFHDCIHVQNVCRTGTHCKLSLVTHPFPNGFCLSMWSIQGNGNPVASCIVPAP